MRKDFRSRPQRVERDHRLVNAFHDLPPSLRLVEADDDGKNQTTVFTREEAWAKKTDSSLDLYLVNDSPPVYKLIDYGKFKFEEQKRLKDAAKKQRENLRSIKEFFFGPSCGKHDIETKVEQIRDLLPDHDVKIGVKLKTHHKFLLTHRWSRTIHEATQAEDFVLNQVIQQLGSAAVADRINVSDAQVYTTLRLPK